MEENSCFSLTLIYFVQGRSISLFSILRQFFYLWFDWNQVCKTFMSRAFKHRIWRPLSWYITSRWLWPFFSSGRSQFYPFADSDPYDLSEKSGDPVTKPVAVRSNPTDGRAFHPIFSLACNNARSFRTSESSPEYTLKDQSNKKKNC